MFSPKLMAVTSDTFFLFTLTYCDAAFNHSFSNERILWEALVQLNPVTYAQTIHGNRFETLVKAEPNPALCSLNRRTKDIVEPI